MKPQPWQPSHRRTSRANRGNTLSISGLELELCSFSFKDVFSFAAARTASLPPHGPEFTLLDKKVIDPLLRSTGKPSQHHRRNGTPGIFTDAGALHQSLAAGTTKWTLGSKLKAFADAFVLFSYIPLRIVSYLGMLCSLSGLAYALLVISLRLRNSTPMQGWSSLMVAILVIGGVQMMMLGVLGEYLWRTFEASQRRPIYLLEETAEAYFTSEVQKSHTHASRMAEAPVVTLHPMSLRATAKRLPWSFCRPAGYCPWVLPRCILYAVA